MRRSGAKPSRAAFEAPGLTDLSRRQLLQAGAGLALAGYGLSGCTVSRQVDRSTAGQVIKPEVDGDLLLYNWAQYMDPTLKKDFSEKYGVEVTEVNFDNLEAMVVKLRSGAQYDMIWPSTEYVARLAAEGLLAKFDRSLLRNIDGVSDFYEQGWWDPNNEYSVPYTYYTTGICWREDEVSGMTGSWNDLQNPDGAGRMFILDDFQEAIGEANLINGFDLNTEIPEELELSKATLLEQKELARGFSTNSVQNLVSGSAVIHQAWNGDIVNVRNQVEEPELYQYETCEEGVPVGTDFMCIPVNARSPGTAMLFMDWIIDPENSARNVRWNGYPQPCDGAKEQFAELVKDTPSIDVDLEAIADSALEYRLDDPDSRRLWTDVFTEVKAS
jgi:spermidine/putrescine transport system substrate-binding protein